MKHQYFGDINDFYKYVLLRRLRDAWLSIQAVWMLTPDDGSRDGRNTSYLDSPGRRENDPELFDWLVAWKRLGQEKNISLIERSGLLASSFFSEVVPENITQRGLWLDAVARTSAGSDVVFFDPDNGLETSSLPKKTKRSHKHLYWDEVRRLWDTGHSVLVYQHHSRVTVPKMLEHRARQARELIGSGQMYFFNSFMIGFFLFCQDAHRARVEAACDDVCAEDSPMYGVSRWPLADAGQSFYHRWTEFGRNEGVVEGATEEPVWMKREPLAPRTEPYGPLTTRPGAVNRNDQVVVRRTDHRGTDHMQYVYVLRCSKCSLEYGANGTDVWQRKCPRCQGGRAGLEIV